MVGPPGMTLAYYNRELCNNFLGFFLSKSPLPPFLPSQEVWDIERCWEACWAPPKASLPHYLGLLGASTVSGPRFQRFNDSMMITRMRMKMTMIVNTVMPDHQIVSNMKLLPDFFGTFWAFTWRPCVIMESRGNALQCKKTRYFCWNILSSVGLVFQLLLEKSKHQSANPVLLQMIR